MLPKPLPAILSASLLLLALSGCAEKQEAETSTFKVMDVKSSKMETDQGVVKVKLKSSGEMSEADFSSIVHFVKIVAKHQATIRQRELAAQRGRRAAQTLRKKARYIAVDTEKSSPVATQSSKPVEKSVMIWDTESQQVVGNEVYDVETAPPVGATAKFDTYSAEYVGSGS